MARYLLLVLAVTLISSCGQRCGEPQLRAQAEDLFSRHYSFYNGELSERPADEGPALTPQLQALLEAHHQCQRQHGQCHLDYDPWLGAQDGEIGAPLSWTLQIDGERAEVVLGYPLLLGAGQAPRSQQVRLLWQRTAAPACWLLADLVTPLGDSLAARYRQPPALP